MLGEIAAAEVADTDLALNVLDPFAGVGRAKLQAALGFAAFTVVGVELEAEWRGDDPLTVAGDATRLDPEWSGAFDAVFTSPCYGNRMADHHEAKDPCAVCRGSGCTVESCLAAHPDDGQDHGLCPACGGSGLSKRHTYRHYLGRMPSARSAAVLQWTDPGYTVLHGMAIREMVRVVRPGGLVVVNMANHLRTLKPGGPQVEQLVVEWWVRALLSHGLKLEEVRRVATPKQRHGANGEARVEGEAVIVCRIPPALPGPPDLFGGGGVG